MKIFLVLAVLIGATCEACEYHRQLAAQQRAQQMQDEARLRSLAAARLRRQQEQAVNDVRDSIYGSRVQSYGDPAAPGASGQSQSSYVTSGLPAGSFICPGSRIYYCQAGARCRHNPSTDEWSCVTERLVIPHYTRYRPPSTTRRFYNARYPQSRIRTNAKLPCRAGYKLTADNSSCVDINECVETEPCDISTETCRNNQGGYTCPCLPGFTRFTGKCVDRDECAVWTKTCGIGKCINSVGSYSCECPSGYEEIGPKRCQDINECDGDPCSEEEICFNTWGGFSCDRPRDCPDGYTKRESTDVTTQVCVLENPGLYRNRTNVITYRKLLVPVKGSADLRRPLGVINFVSPNLEYYHYFTFDTVIGEQDFWVKKAHGTSNVLKLEFFNRKPLQVRDELPLVIKITDSPVPKRSHRYDPITRRYVPATRILPSSREVTMIIIHSNLSVTSLNSLVTSHQTSLSWNLAFFDNVTPSDGLLRFTPLDVASESDLFIFDEQLASI